MVWGVVGRVFRDGRGSFWTPKIEKAWHFGLANVGLPFANVYRTVSARLPKMQVTGQVDPVLLGALVSFSYAKSLGQP